MPGRAHAGIAVNGPKPNMGSSEVDPQREEARTANLAEASLDSGRGCVARESLSALRDLEGMNRNAHDAGKSRALPLSTPRAMAVDGDAGFGRPVPNGSTQAATFDVALRRPCCIFRHLWLLHCMSPL